LFALVQLSGLRQYFKTLFLFLFLLTAWQPENSSCLPACWMYSMPHWNLIEFCKNCSSSTAELLKADHTKRSKCRSFNMSDLSFQEQKCEVLSQGMEW
jgi:hypothetical protein